MTALARDSIAQFIEEGSWTARAKMVERIATRYVEGGLGEVERCTAEDLFRLALYDGEALVRRVLAETLKHATEMPRDIVLALAHDVVDVAAPFLAASPLLEDDELMPIVAGGSSAHRLAVTARRPLSSRIADALGHCGDPTVLRRLLANDEAAISEATLHAILSRAADPLAFADAIARRRVLPVSIISRLAGHLPHRRRGDGAERPLLRLAGPNATN